MQSLHTIIAIFTAYHAIALVIQAVMTKLFLLSGIGIARLALRPAKTAKSAVKTAGKIAKHAAWCAAGIALLTALS